VNKTKLEVIRINEDVIATSGPCIHLSEYYHLYYSKNDGIVDNNPVYLLDATSGKLTQAGSAQDFDMVLYGIDSNGWWYGHLEGAHLTWTKCEEQQDVAHPVQPD